VVSVRQLLRDGLRRVEGALRKYVCSSSTFPSIPNLTAILEYNADVSWRIISPNPEFAFVAGDEELRQFSHSVLVVQIEEGRAFIFDCTGEQFGWAGSGWLMELEAFSERMDEDELPDLQGSLGFTKRVISKQPEGYWPRIFTTFSEMFKAFEWERLPLEDPAMAVRVISSTAAKRAKAAALATWGPGP